MRTQLLVLLTLSACVAEVPGDYSNYGSTESELTASERRTRAAQIRDAANAAGMTQGWMLTGIAQAETGLAHCWSEATWACRGPSSPDCGGGPVIAGSGDGACSLEQGGLGLFQFDGGTFSQTLARDGSGILRIDGNVTHAVTFVTNMVKNSNFIPGVSTDAQAIDWMNGVRIDNARWDAWISTVVRHYNGCRPTSSCWAGRYASYRDKTRDVFNEMGAAFWSTTGGDGGGAPPPPPAGPTIRDIADRGACSTAGAEGLSAQLAEAQRCMNPGTFVRFAPHPGITLTSDRVHPYAQASARDALHRAAASRPLSINSAFRTVADQYVLYHSGGCGLAAAPGRSNHQSGRAVDVSNHSSVRSTLQAQGCRWLGSRDPVHFDCPGTDQRNNSVRAFQELWNVNNPSDTITVDGLYGNQTGSRLAMAPAGGFTRGVCDEAPVEPPVPGTSEMRGVLFAEGDIDNRVGGATVRIVETDETVLSASADGAWSFSVPDGTYTLEASATGFATTRQSCIVTGDVWCSIEMTRGAASSEGIASGQLFADDGMGTGAAITTGQVVVTETGLRASPDASGRYSLALPAGTYTLVGSAEGFSSVTRSCTVRASAESTCSLGLVPEAAAQELVGVVFTQGDIFTRVVNARVRILETDAETTSREGDGLFLFNVAPGVYTVEVSGSGIEDGLRVCTVGRSTTWCSVGVMRNGDSFGVGFEETNDEGVVADLDDLERADTASITGSACSASAGSSGTPTPWMLALTFMGAAVLRRRR